MNIDFNTANIIRLVIYIITAVIAFAVLIKFLKFVLGIIVGFVITLILAYLYYINC